MIENFTLLRTLSKPLSFCEIKRSLKTKITKQRFAVNIINLLSLYHENYCISSQDTMLNDVLLTPRPNLDKISIATEFLKKTSGRCL